ncbi:MAG: hypothetical protein K5863_09060 [Nitratireductor sp.]|uniref:hypothetical protein n=1 Tax=Nitratireductor sp. TaxID=1872084 RepID=UPI0026177C90|nr:hypothetical protein [Nitratireductor sp.]MCV0350213.1 hypothetical protein [Nitratireductor sp.]
MDKPETVCASDEDQPVQHPYFKTHKAEQHEAALEFYKVDAARYLENQRRLNTGRVLEPVQAETRH